MLTQCFLCHLGFTERVKARNTAYHLTLKKFLLKYLKCLLEICKQAKFKPLPHRHIIDSILVITCCQHFMTCCVILPCPDYYIAVTRLLNQASGTEKASFDTGSFNIADTHELGPRGCTPYNGLYGEAPPERGTFFRLQVY